MNKMYPDFAIKNKITRSYQVEVCHTCIIEKKAIVNFMNVYIKEAI